MIKLTEKELSKLAQCLNEYSSIWVEKYSKKDERLNMMVGRILCESGYTWETYKPVGDFVFDTIEYILDKYGETKHWTIDELDTVINQLAVIADN